jgi:hypothetical protein
LLSTRAPVSARFLRDRSKPLFAIFERTIMHKSMKPEKSMTVFPKTSCSILQRPAAIRPLGVTGTVPVTSERMDAIRNIKTMAGSPDADLLRSGSRHLAHGFCVFGDAPLLS